MSRSSCRIVGPFVLSISVWIISKYIYTTEHIRYRFEQRALREFHLETLLGPQ